MPQTHCFGAYKVNTTLQNDRILKKQAVRQLMQFWLRQGRRITLLKSLQIESLMSKTAIGR